jgi:hypothetical protein
MGTGIGARITQESAEAPAGLIAAMYVVAKTTTQATANTAERFIFSPNVTVFFGIKSVFVKNP